MNDQRGMTLVELLAALAIGSLLLTAAMLISIPLMARETLRAAAHDVTSFLQLAKIEAVSRNRDCVFVIGTTERTLSVWDTLGTLVTTDDVLLHERQLASSVTLGRPDVGSPISLGALGVSGRYGVFFGRTGSVTQGAGELFLEGGSSFARVAVHSAGGVEIAFWDGAQWKPGA